MLSSSDCNKTNTNVTKDYTSFYLFLFILVIYFDYGLWRCPSFDMFCCFCYHHASVTCFVFVNLSLNTNGNNK